VSATVADRGKSSGFRVLGDVARGRTDAGPTVKTDPAGGIGSEPEGLACQIGGVRRLEELAGMTGSEAMDRIPIGAASDLLARHSAPEGRQNRRRSISVAFGAPATRVVGVGAPWTRFDHSDGWRCRLA
jgi:hypothetical protein